LAEEIPLPSLTSDPADHRALRDPRVILYATRSGRSVLPVGAAELETPEARSLWAWWSRAAASGQQPHRNDFDVVEHRQLAANLYLIEPVAGGFRLRLAGEVFQQLFRRSRGHVWLRDAPEPLAQAFRATLSPSPRRRPLWLRASLSSRLASRRVGRRPKGNQRIGAMTMMSIDQFKNWLKRGKRTKSVGKLPPPKGAAGR
jgi:hypothetical protein